MLRMTTILAATTSLMAAPVFAGSADEPMEEPVIEAPAPVSTSPDWTGFYGGGQLGFASVDTDAGVDGSGMIGGLTAGYDYDLGNNWVLGAGLDYDFADVDLEDGAGTTVGTLEEVFRAKLRGGYKIGDGLLYGTGGYAHADTDNLGSDDGWFAGAGYEHMVTQNVSVGGEVLYHQFDNFDGSGIDVDATTVQARATFRF